MSTLLVLNGGARPGKPRTWCRECGDWHTRRQCPKVVARKVRPATEFVEMVRQAKRALGQL